MMDKTETPGWEAGIATQVLSGDIDAFESIVRAYEKRLRSFCRSRIPQSEVEDAMQDVFLKVFKKLSTYNSTYSFAVWFFTVAHSCVSDKKLRFKRDLKTVDRLITYYDASSPRNEGQEWLEADMARKLVSQLNGKNRRIAELYYFAELSVAEVAKALSLNQSAVKARLFRSRKEMIKLMETKQPKR